MTKDIHNNPIESINKNREELQQSFLAELQSLESAVQSSNQNNVDVCLDEVKSETTGCPTISLSHSSNTIKGTLTTIRVPDRVPEINEPTAGNTPCRMPNRVPDRVPEINYGWDISDALKSHGVLRWMVNPQDANQTIYNLCSTVLHHGGSQKKFDELFSMVPFDDLFGADDWRDVAGRCLTRMKKEQKFKAGFLLYPFASLVAAVATAEQLVVPSKQQKITAVECGYIAKQITARIKSNHDKDRRDYALINHQYFLNPKYAAVYKTVTGRSVGKSVHKIAAITDLLSELDIIVKEKRIGEDGKQQRNLYRIGGMNPYAAKFKKLS